MATHRLERPLRERVRYGRLLAAGAAVGVTVVATLGGLGIVPIAAVNAEPPESQVSAITEPRAAPGAADPADPDGAGDSPSGDQLPARSGQGRRVVFSIGGQRVWLVGAAGTVADTYLVSGSVTDNLQPGSYRVYSRSRWAVGIEDSGNMEFFVRFTRGDNAAIGFHSIPKKDGVPLQTVAQLGTPQSHGCIRQRRADAVRMWDFAPVGTRVVVVA